MPCNKRSLCYVQLNLQYYHRRAQINGTVYKPAVCNNIALACHHSSRFEHQVVLVEVLYICSYQSLRIYRVSGFRSFLTGLPSFHLFFFKNDFWQINICLFQIKPYYDKIHIEPQFSYYHGSHRSDGPDKTMYPLDQQLFGSIRWLRVRRRGFGKRLYYILFLIEKAEQARRRYFF